MKAKRSGWTHPAATSSRHHLSRRILTGKRRATRLYRLARIKLTETELDKEASTMPMNETQHQRDERLLRWWIGYYGRHTDLTDRDAQETAIKEGLEEFWHHERAPERTD